MDIILGAIYPRFCLSCGIEGDVLCAECDRAIKTKLTHSKEGTYLFDYHDKTFGRLLHAWKFLYDEQAGNVLMDYVSAERRALRKWVYSIGVTSIAWVPSHSERKRSRGFDQAELLAVHLAGVLNLPLVPVLERVRATGHQSHLSKVERANQMEDNPFALISTGDDLVIESILLVDDVVTTGATIKAASSLLKEQGATVTHFSLAFAV